MTRLLRALAWAVALALAALSLGAIVPRAPAAPAAPGAYRVLVVAGPIHTDILLPLDARTRALFAFAAEAGVPVDAAGARWLAVGWGGRAFYLETPT